MKDRQNGFGNLISLPSTALTLDLIFQCSHTFFLLEKGRIRAGSNP